MKTLYTYKGAVPLALHKEVYDYCQNNPWVSKWHHDNRFKKLDPAREEWKDDLVMQYNHRFLYRLPFAANSVELSQVDVMNRLFNHINDHCFNGRYTVDGSHKEGIVGTGRQWSAYMNAQPYDTVKRTKSIHRDWDKSPVDSNSDEYSTMVFISNLEWRPSWFSEMLFYNEEDTGDKHGESLLSSEEYIKRGEDIGWPVSVIPNVPGMVVLFDGRWWHSTKPTSYLAPELSQHIVFRVRRKE